MKFENIAVIGAGVMGVGVSQALVQTGHNVILVDTNPLALDRAKAEIANNLRLSAIFDPKVRELDHKKIIQNIKFTEDYQSVKEADFVVENVTENIAVKESVYKKLDSICSRNCIFVVNTSAVPILHLSLHTSRPDRCIGIHFMNPVPQKAVVELIRSAKTGEETLNATKTLLTRMGKKYISVKDVAGFVSNRVLMLTINEAITLVQDRVAEIPDIDSIFESCFEHKMGPLATADLIGLDTILLTLEVLMESYDKSKYQPCSLLVEMVGKGLLGRKSGRGFYNYS